MIDTIKYIEKIALVIIIFATVIAIGYEIVNKRSKRSNFNYEFDKMWVHGYLHLLGYDHKKLREFKKMHKLEKKILNYIESTN